MKRFKKLLQEVAAANNASFASGGSSPSTKFSGVMGFGSISGDSPAANKPGKGDGKDITPEITAAINAGVKRNSIVKGKETGALQFRGVDGTLYNSPHAAIESSRSDLVKTISTRGVRFSHAITEQILGAIKSNVILITFDNDGKFESAKINPEYRDWDWIPDWFNNPEDDIKPRPGDPGIRPEGDPFNPQIPGPPGFIEPGVISPLDDLFDLFDGEGRWRRRLRDNWDDRYDKLKPNEWKRWQRQYGTSPPPPSEPPGDDFDGNPTENPPGSGQWWHHNPPADGMNTPPIGQPHPPGWNPTFPPGHPSSPYYVPPSDGNDDEAPPVP